MPPPDALAIIALTTLALFAVSFASLIRLTCAGVLEGRNADGSPSLEAILRGSNPCLRPCRRRGPVPSRPTCPSAPRATEQYPARARRHCNERDLDHALWLAWLPGLRDISIAFRNRTYADARLRTGMCFLPQSFSPTSAGAKSRPFSDSRYSYRSGRCEYAFLSRTPWSTSRFRRSDSTWRVTPRLVWNSSNLDFPRKQSRTISIVQRSPITDSARATGHPSVASSSHRLALESLFRSISEPCTDCTLMQRA